jgi:hypothetical protein
MTMASTPFDRLGYVTVLPSSSNDTVVRPTAASPIASTAASSSKWSFPVRMSATTRSAPFTNASTAPEGVAATNRAIGVPKPAPRTRWASSASPLTSPSGPIRISIRPS